MDIARRPRRLIGMEAPVFVLTLIFGIVLTGTGVARAYEPVTFGDVQAQFEAIENGGAVVFSKFGPENTIPPASPLLHSIRPIKEFFDGRHYCTLDWQLITIAFIASPEDVSLSTTDELKAFLEATTVTFSIDGVPTPAAETTAVKTANSGFFEVVPGEVFWRAWGNFYAPGVLPVGKHTLTGSGTDPIESFKLDRITFYIDPVGSGACL
jgi:hypothetical protein